MLDRETQEDQGCWTEKQGLCSGRNLPFGDQSLDPLHTSPYPSSANSASGLPSSFRKWDLQDYFQVEMSKWTGEEKLPRLPSASGQTARTVEKDGANGLF